MAYGNDFSRIYGRQGLDYFFLSSLIRALLEQVVCIPGYLPELGRTWGKLDKDQRKTKGKSPVGELGRAFAV